MDAAISHRRRWTNRAVAREVDRERARWLWGLLLAGLLAAAPFAAYMLEQNECVRLSYEASSLRIEHDRLLEEQRRLRVRRASLESLESIEAWALRRHGMTRPVADQVVVVRPAGAQRTRPN